MLSAQSTQSRRPSPGFSSLCAPGASAFSSSPLPFDISTFELSNLQTILPLSPFFATLTSPLQPPENTATLSPAFATLTRRVNHNPFVCHSYTKQPGWGSHPSNVRVRSVPGSFSDHDSRNTDHNSHPLLVIRHSPSVAASALFLPPVTGLQSQVTKSFTIRTYRKCAYNFFRIPTSKTQYLKPFRINTYEKRPGGRTTSRSERPSRRTTTKV
jgi:hypothetical protein